jgi:Mor family transcriptional regulator
MKIRHATFQAERNKNIWQDRCNGMTYKDLAQKYGLTQPRVRDIYEDYDRHYNTEAWKKRNGFVYY